MLNPTVEMVLTMYGETPNAMFVAQTKHDRDQVYAWDQLHNEMDGVECEDILKATKDHKLEKDEQYKKIASQHKVMVQELIKQKQEHLKVT